MFRNKYKKSDILIKLVFGLFLLGLILYKIGIPNIIQVLNGFSVFWLIPLLALNVVILLIGSMNFLILLKGSSTKISYLKLVKYYIISTTVGLFVPGKLGEFSMIFFLYKEGQEVGEASAINVLDKVVTLFLLSFIATVGAFFYLAPKDAIRLTLGVLVLCLLALFLLSRMGRQLIKKLILRKYSRKFRGFSKSLLSYTSKHKDLIFLDAVATIIKLIVQAIVIYFLFIAFNNPIALYKIFTINALLIIISLLPISISGLGIREGSSVVLFSLIGVPALLTISVQLVFLFLRYSQGLLAVLLFFEKDMFSANQVR